MRRWSPFARLLWVEYRQARLILALLLLLPPGFALASRYGDVGRPCASALRLGFWLILFLWPASRGRLGQGRNASREDVLPVTPQLRWLAAFAAPVFAATALSAWFGGWSAQSLQSDGVVAAAVEAGLAAAAGFALSCYASAWSQAAVMLVSASCVAALFLHPLFSGVIFARHPPLPAERYLLFVVLAAGIGSLLPGAIRHRRPTWLQPALRFAISGAVVAACVALPSGRPDRSAASPYTWWLPPRIDASDWSCAVAPAASRGGPATVRLVAEDFRSGKRVIRAFANVVVPLDILDSRRIYLAQQSPGEREVRILQWDAQTDRLKELGTLPAGRDALACTARPGKCAVAIARPDGRYLLLSLRSLVSPRGRDLWAVDLVTGRSRVVCAGRDGFRLDASRVYWDGRRAMLVTWRGVLPVDLGPSIPPRREAGG